jgi:hypothetical protein
MYRGLCVLCARRGGDDDDDDDGASPCPDYGVCGGVGGERSRCQSRNRIQRRKGSGRQSARGEAESGFVWVGEGDLSMGLIVVE